MQILLTGFYDWIKSELLMLTQINSVTIEVTNDNDCLNYDYYEIHF